MLAVKSYNTYLPTNLPTYCNTNHQSSREQPERLKSGKGKEVDACLLVILQQSATWYLNWGYINSFNPPNAQSSNDQKFHPRLIMMLASAHVPKRHIYTVPYNRETTKRTERTPRALW